MDYLLNLIQIYVVNPLFMYLEQRKWDALMNQIGGQK